MNAGDLRHKIALFSPTRGENDAGETGVVWTYVRHQQAQVKPLRAWEVERARQVQTNRTHLIRVRYANDIAPDWRIEWDGRIFNIKGIVNPEERDIELEISCEEEGAAVTP